MNNPTSPGPVSPVRLFGWLRWRIFRHAWDQLFEHSSLRAMTVALCCFVIWIFIFGISCAGFVFLKEAKTFHLGGGLVGMLFDLLFLALTVMLIFSTALILYSSLFAKAETSFLLSSPASEDQIFAYKYQGAVAFSSWAFLLLGSPILIGFGLIYKAPWYFYALMPFYFAGFVLIPGSVGALICLLIVNFVPQRRKQVLIVTLVAAGLLGFVWVYGAMQSLHSQTFTRDAVAQLLGRFDIAQAPLMPSHWIAWGLRSAARKELEKAFYYLALIWSNGLFLYLLAAWASRRLYRRGFNRLTTGGDLRKRYGGHWLDGLLNRLLVFVDPQTRLLIVKDFRTFRRDPAQWAQVLIFSILLTLYFVNVRRFFLSDITWEYQNSISLLNLCATALLLCTYTGRFIYPMLSLEGRKFWILGLLPLKRERLLWGKFLFSATGSLLIAEILVLISDLMLQMPALLIVLHVLTVAVLAVGLSGLSVGLGASMPNFRETDPSKIAVGFGGTMNLVVGLFYLIVIIGFMTGPWHVLAALEGGPVKSVGGLVTVAVGCGIGLIAGVLAVVVPLGHGARAMRRMEF